MRFSYNASIIKKTIQNPNLTFFKFGVNCDKHVEYGGAHGKNKSCLVDKKTKARNHPNLRTHHINSIKAYLAHPLRYFAATL